MSEKTATHVVLPIQTFNLILKVLQELPYKNVANVIAAVQSGVSGVAETEDGYDEIENDPARGAAGG